MLFNSLEYIVFLPLVFVVYWFIWRDSIKLQNVFILIVSYVFYGYWDWRFLILIFMATLVDYIVAIEIDKHETKRKKELLLGISIFFNLGMLFYFKYYNFFIESFSRLLTSIGLPSSEYSLQVILPVGISFYTFQTMSYTIDVYRGKMPACRDITAFFAYVSFFPQLVAGPIERAVNLLPQFFMKRRFSYHNGVDGLRFLLWGFFKKLVVADNCSIYVNSVFADYQDATSEQLIMGAIMFAFQIYGDFSGYSDIATGSAKLLGFDLTRNFCTPYFSRDIAEFWRRWHISLTAWFKDYVYIPLGGSKMGQARTVFNVFIIFLLSGLWHGANWTFVAWGMINAIFFLPLLLMKTNRRDLAVVAHDRNYPTLGEVFQIIRTFILVCLAWIFFRSPTIWDALNYLYSITQPGAGIREIDYSLPLFAVTVLLFFDWTFRKSHVPFSDRDGMSFVRYVSYLLILLAIIFYGAYINPQSFIYFQF